MVTMEPNKSSERFLQKKPTDTLAQKGELGALVCGAGVLRIRELTLSLIQESKLEIRYFCKNNITQERMSAKRHEGEKRTLLFLTI